MARPAMSMDVRGMKELQATLRLLPRRLGQAALRRGLKRGAQPIIEEARRNIDSNSGDLAGGITTRAAPSRNKNFAAIKVGPSNAPHAHLVEFGTAPHLIRARHAQSLKIGPVLVGKAVKHPGARPKPFMRPALDAKEGAATVETGKALALAVEKTARRYAKRRAR